MPKRLVRDIMVPLNDYTTISVDATIGEAIKTLQKSFKKEGRHVVIGHTSAIVLDSKHEVVGILTLRSLLKAIEFEALKSTRWKNITIWAGLFNKNNLRKHANLRVKDIMRSIEVAYVNASDTVTKAAHTILTYQVNTLPVIEDGKESLLLGEYCKETKKAVGIIRTIDIFDIIGDVLDVDNKIIDFPVHRK